MPYVCVVGLVKCCPLGFRAGNVCSPLTSPVDLQLWSMLKRCLTLRRLKDGWTYCHYINQKEAWVTLGKAALEHLDIDYAIRYAPSAANSVKFLCLVPVLM